MVSIALLWSLSFYFCSFLYFLVLLIFFLILECFTVSYCHTRYEPMNVGINLFAPLFVMNCSIGSWMRNLIAYYSTNKGGALALSPTPPPRFMSYSWAFCVVLSFTVMGFLFSFHLAFCPKTPIEFCCFIAQPGLTLPPLHGFFILCSYCRPSGESIGVESRFHHRIRKFFQVTIKGTGWPRMPQTRFEQLCPWHWTVSGHLKSVDSWATDFSFTGFSIDDKIFECVFEYLNPQTTRQGIYGGIAFCLVFVTRPW